MANRRVKRNLFAECFGNDFRHGNGRPLARNVDGLTLVLKLFGVVHCSVGCLDNTLSKLLHALQVVESAVGFHGSELRVVSGIHTFVAEDTTDLEHALETANQQTLQVKLGGNTQIVFLIQRIEVRDERLSGCTALHGLKDGRFHLVITVRLHVAAESREDLRALLEGIAHFIVNDKVDIALAVTGLFVVQAMKLFRQRTQRLGEQLERINGNRKLAATRAHHKAMRANPVAQVEVFHLGKDVFAQSVDAAEELNATGGILELEEDDFALNTLGHNTARNGNSIFGVFAIGQLGVLFIQVDNVMGVLECSVTIRVLALCQ